MKTNIYILIKSILVIVVLQNILCGFIWLIGDTFGLYSSVYYIDIENLPPLKQEWEKGIYPFLEYLLYTYINIFFIWGACFIINALTYLKSKLNIILILSLILLNSFLYTYIIFIKLLDIYFWNELIKICISSFLFCIYIVIKHIIK